MVVRSLALKLYNIYFCLCWVFVAVGATLQLQCAGFSLGGFFCCGAQILGRMGFSSCSSRTLEHRLDSCGTRAQLLQIIWGLPRSGIEPVFSALAGRFFTTEPAKKLRSLHIKFHCKIKRKETFKIFFFGCYFIIKQRGNSIFFLIFNKSKDIWILIIFFKQ